MSERKKSLFEVRHPFFRPQSNSHNLCIIWRKLAKNFPIGGIVPGGLEPHRPAQRAVAPTTDAGALRAPAAARGAPNERVVRRALVAATAIGAAADGLGAARRVLRGQRAVDSAIPMHARADAGGAGAAPRARVRTEGQGASLATPPWVADAHAVRA